MTSPLPRGAFRNGSRTMRSLGAMALVLLLVATSAAVSSMTHLGPSTDVTLRTGVSQPAIPAPTRLSVAANPIPGLAAPASWINVTPASGGVAPPASESASSAYDAADNVTVLFGGCQDLLCPSNQTWLFAGGRWVNATNPANAPPARYEAAMDYDANMRGVLLFGGSGVGGVVLNDTWLYANQRWTNLSWVGPAPPGRRGASMAFDPQPEENGSVLFGGALPSAATTNDTWVWEGWSGWVRLPTSIAPLPVEFASMAYDAQDQYLLLVDGVVPCGFLACLINETWELYAGEWWPVHPAGPGPAARFWSSMAYDGGSGEVVLFGGVNGTFASLNDTWTYAGGAWQSVSSLQAPSPRYWAALSPDSGPGAPILFGGAGPSANQNDTWAFERPPAVGLVPPAGALEASVPVIVNLTVTGGTAPYRALVDFGDGSVASVTGPGPTLSTSHAFASAGSYVLSANLTDAVGVPASATSPAVTVAAGPVVAVHASAFAVDAGSPVRLTATLVSSGMPPVTFAWSLGDGATASGANVTHTFASPGSYVATVTATDGAGAEANASLSLVVNPPPLLAAAVAPASTNASSPVRLFANVTGGTAPFVYTWRFGDGSASGSPSPVHAFDRAGTYTVNVWVNDSSGATAHATLTVDVAAAVSGSAGIPGWFWPALLALVAVGIVGVAALLRWPRRPKAPSPPA